LVGKESYLLELCRYIGLNLLRVKGGVETGVWKWSSYQAAAVRVNVPQFLSIDWLLAQSCKNRGTAQKRYREFVRDGLEIRSWDELKGQIYLGSEEFIEQHSAEDKEIKDIPRVQQKAVRPTLERIFAKGGKQG